MDLYECPKGHVYDKSEYDFCPYCNPHLHPLEDYGRPFVDQSNFGCVGLQPPDSFGPVVEIGGWKADESVNYRRIALCSRCGKFYGLITDKCPHCGGEAALIEGPGTIGTVDREGNLYTDIRSRELAYYDRDPIEKSIFYEHIQEELERLLEAEFPPDRPYQFDECHLFWKRKQQILLERYHIRWRTPAEMNRDVCCDCNVTWLCRWCNSHRA